MCSLLEQENSKDIMINHKGTRIAQITNNQHQYISAKLLKIRNGDLAPLNEFLVACHVILICREMNVWRLMICGNKVIQDILLCLSRISSQEPTFFNSFIAKQWMSFCGEGENGVSRNLRRRM